MAKLSFRGVEESIVTREEFPLYKAQEILKDETVTVIGYDVQGSDQSLNLKDIRDSELWQAGKTVHSLRPEEK